MLFFSRWSLRTQLIFLVIISILPALGIIAWSGIEQRRVKIEEIQRSSFSLMQTIAGRQQVITENSRQFLYMLSRMPEVQKLDRKACITLFRRLLPDNPVYSNIFMLNKDGMVISSAVPSTSWNFSDRKSFNDAVSTRDFSTGDYVISRITKGPVFPLSYPIMGKDGVVRGVLVATLDLQRYGHIITEAKLPKNSAIIMTDYKFIRVYRYPGGDRFIGQPLSREHIGILSSAPDDGMVKETGEDGIKRFYAFRKFRLSKVSPPYLYMGLGIPEEDALSAAWSVTKRNLFLLGIVSLLALISAWYLGSYLIADPLNRLIAVTNRFRQGEREVRTDLPHTDNELGRLAAAFDEMAVDLKNQEEEQVRIEEELRQSEEQFRSLAESAPDAIFVQSDGRFVYVNAAMLRLLGASRAEELLGSDFRQRMAPEYLDAMRNRIEIQRETGKPVPLMEQEYLRLDGSRVPVETTAVAIRFEGKAAHLVFARDITARRQAEEKLKEREEIFSSTVSQAVDSIAVLDVSTARFIEFNTAAHAELGYTREEFSGFGIPDIQAEHSPEAIRRKLELVRQHGSIQFETRHRHRNGELRDVHVRLQKLNIRNQDYMAGVWTDITEQKHAEAALRESEEMLRTIFDNSPTALEIYDKEATLMRCNRKVGEIFGLEADAQIGKFNLKKDPNYQDKAVWDRLHRGEEVRHVVEFDFSRVPYETTRTGKAYFDIMTSPIPDRISRSIGYIVQLVDITERVRALEEREGLQFQLLQAQRLESVGRLAGGVAHDFNNMLGVILGHAEMVLEQPDLNHRLRTDLEQIRKAAERSADLTRQLLAFARRQTVSPKVLDLNETVEGMLKMLRRLIGEDIELHWKPGHHVGQIHMDPSQIDQILANLCVNARDAISGIGKVVIETGNVTFDDAYSRDHLDAASGEYLMLAISDNGCGMDKDTLDKLFEPFFTTKELGKGTGLGLATVYGIMKQNNGFINVYSEPNQGTTFKLYFPLYAGKPEGADREAAPKPIQGGKETVLVVEDEPAILEMTQRMLMKQGYTLLTATTPGEAVETAQAYGGDIHLLITDVVMPEMNGRDLAEHILPFHPKIRKLFMSGYTADVIAHHGVLDEGVHFIQKPFSLRDLTAKVREALDKD